MTTGGTPPSIAAGDRVFAIAVMSLPGIGPVRARKLLDAAGCFEAAWSDLANSLVAAGIPTAHHPRLLAARAATDPDQCAATLERHSIEAVFAGDESYPRGFAAMHDPPLVVYIRGELVETDHLACAIVGTRRASPYGRWITTKIAAGLARAKVTVVSGLALGIDAAAHAAALAAGGRSLAVLAGGLDRVYPIEHEPLAARIAQDGALLSEYFPGLPTLAGNFVARNRLIAALGLVTLVCEAGRRSGAMLTARFAADYGRDILAIPGRVGDPGSSGVNELIRDGAGLVQSTQDVLAALGLAAAGIGEDEFGAGVARGDAEIAGSPLARSVLAALRRGPQREDQLLAGCQAEPGGLRAELTLLELQGRIARWPGGLYCLREDRSAP
jgi:DNA processing protein